MKPEDIKNIIEFALLVISICTTVFGLGWKLIKGITANRLAIGIEKAKQNSVGEDAINRLAKSLDHIVNDIMRAESKVLEIERDWRDFRTEIRETNSRYLEIFKEWADGIKDNRDYLNKNRP